MKPKKGLNSWAWSKWKSITLPIRISKSDGVEMTRAIEKAIMREKPDIIFTHSEHDLHQDHKAVFEATLRGDAELSGDDPVL